MRPARSPLGALGRWSLIAAALVVAAVRKVHAELAPSERRPLRPGRASRLRARLLLSTLLLVYGALAYRLYVLQVVEHAKWAEAADRQHVRLRTIEPERGRLLMRDGVRRVPAAVSVERFSLLVEGRAGQDPEFLAKLTQALPDLTAHEREQVARRLAQGRAFYLRRRRLTYDDVVRVRAVQEATRLARISLEREPVRAYPYGALAAQVLGVVGADPTWNTGLERVLEAALTGTPGRREVRLDNRHGELVMPGAVLVPAQKGCDALLTLDRSVQAVAEAELAAVAEAFEPDGAAAVVVDVTTGDVLALASWPTFDPNTREGDAARGLRNRAITDTYEPGSTIKPLLLGTAWELGLGGPDRALLCPRTLKVPGRRKPIVDSHTVGHATELQALVESSNTGAYQVTARLSPEQLRHALAGFGLGRETGLGLPGESNGDLRQLARLPEPNTLGSIAQGYAVTVTPLQMALAYAALANGGTLMRPRLIEAIVGAGPEAGTFDPQPVARPLSRATTDDGLRRALTAVVNSERGTAKRARSDRYTIAGKTGTTKLLVDGRYHEREIVASFCGYAPAERPRLAFAVVVWAPNPKKSKTGRVWGGTVAAPVAGKIAEQALHLLRVEPTRTVEAAK